jgi:hypothetical protein
MTGQKSPLLIDDSFPGVESGSPQFSPDLALQLHEALNTERISGYGIPMSLVLISVDN